MIHNTPKPGDIGLVRIKGLVGWLIRILQWLNGDGFSHFEHAFIVLENGMLIEAMPGGAQIVPLSEYDGEDVRYVSPPNLTEFNRQQICAIARSFEGVEYSFLDYAALAAHRFQFPLPGLQEYVASTGHMICSQLVERTFDLASKPLFSDGRWDGYVTPGRIGLRLS